MTKRAWISTVLVVAFGVLGSRPYSQAGTITIIQRESLGRNNLFAGSGGAVQQSDISDDTAALTGPFSFSDSGAVAVSESDPFSGGAADATGTISVSDNVTQPSPSSLTLTASRLASGEANHISGTGNGNSAQRQTSRVRFQVIDGPALYTLVGNFDPGVITGLLGDAHQVKLHRPFTANVLVDATTAATFNEIGILDAGKTYELNIRLNDISSANAGNPFAADASSLEIFFNVISLSELTPGDSNGDGKVDGLDYLVWAANFGDDPADDPPGSPINGDFNDDGVVNGLDYLVWASNFGMGPNDAVAVPEPGAWALLIMGAAAMFSRRRSRHAS